MIEKTIFEKLDAFISSQKKAITSFKQAKYQDHPMSMISFYLDIINNQSTHIDYLFNVGNICGYLTSSLELQHCFQLLLEYLKPEYLQEYSNMTQDLYEQMACIRSKWSNTNFYPNKLEDLELGAHLLKSHSSRAMEVN